MRRGLPCLTSALVAACLFATGAVAAAYNLPDSDQRGCYMAASPYAQIACAGTGQDGAYLLHSLSYTDNGNGTVTDNNTGLVWQRQDDGLARNWYRASGTYDATYNPEGTNYCGSLVLGGASDWRLPTREEVVGIVDYDVPWPGPSIDTTAFPGTRDTIYWSSTPYLANPANAWWIQFNYGLVYNITKAQDGYVRCVRGVTTPGPALADNGNGTVTDGTTGLVWQKGDPGSTNWGAALSYCEGLTLAGSSDWRLPDIKELQSLVDVARYGPAVDTAKFPGAQASTYWASTSYVANPSYGWFVNFLDGYAYGLGKDGISYVRCVRAGGTEPDVNDPPTDISLSSAVVEEGLPAGAIVGTLATTDPDAGDTFTYALVPGIGDATSFQIVGNQLRTAAALSFAVKNRFSVRVTSTDSGQLSTEKDFTVTPPTYVLWTRSDTGQAALMQLTPGSAAGKPKVTPLADSAYLHSAGGVGGPWQATSFQRESASAGYVLWTRSDTGQAALWKVDPSSGSGTPKVIPLPAPPDGSSYLSSAVGGWAATSYAHVSANLGYVLWSRSATGQAALWRIDPSAAAGKPPTIGTADSAYLQLPAGIGAGWQATSYAHVSASLGYVLWTRSATGQAALWQINPGSGSGSPKVIAFEDSAYLNPAGGIGAGWEATGYDHVSATEGYVLWTRSATGQAALWQIDPSSGSGTPKVVGAAVDSSYLLTSAGVGGPWQATGCVHGSGIGTTAP